jgi:hypothetical protein
LECIAFQEEEEEEEEEDEALLWILFLCPYMSSTSS